MFYVGHSCLLQPVFYGCEGIACASYGCHGEGHELYHKGGEGRAMGLVGDLVDEDE